jgi:hypothetical protein
MLVLLHALLLLDVMLEALLFSSSLSHRQEDIHEAFSDILRLLIVGILSATGVLPAGLGQPLWVRFVRARGNPFKENENSVRCSR